MFIFAMQSVSRQSRRVGDGDDSPVGMEGNAAESKKSRPLNASPDARLQKQSTKQNLWEMSDYDDEGDKYMNEGFANIQDEVQRKASMRQDARVAELEKQLKDMKNNLEQAQSSEERYRQTAEDHSRKINELQFEIEASDKEREEKEKTMQFYIDSMYKLENENEQLKSN